MIVKFVKQFFKRVSEILTTARVLQFQLLH